MKILWLQRRVCVGLWLVIAAMPAWAQRHRDPFTPPEIDQIRDASWEPEQRLSLYVKFARARLVGLHADCRSSDTLRRCRQRLRCYCNAQRRNPFKPQTAAIHASHVHLLQLSRKIAQSPAAVCRFTSK